MFQALYADLARAHRRRRQREYQRRLEAQAQHEHAARPASHAGPVTPAPEPAGTFRSGVVPAGSSMSGRGADALASRHVPRRRQSRRPCVRRPDRRPSSPPSSTWSSGWTRTASPTPRTTSGTVRLHADGGHEVLAGDRPGRERGPDGLPALRARGRRTPGRGSPPTTPTRMPPQRILSLFADADRSPDLAVVHTPRHYFPDEGGHHGEHGSLDVIQSRAPLVLAGAGVAPLGYVDDHARLVDVGPTLALLAGVPATPTCATREGEPLDGRVLTAYLEPAARAAAAPGRRHPLGRRPLRRPAAPGRGRASCPASPGWSSGAGAARRCGRAVPERHADQPHLDPHRGRARAGTACWATCSTTARPASGSCPTTQTTWHRSAEWLRPAVRTVFEMVNDHVDRARARRAPPASTRRSTAGPTTRRWRCIRASGSCDAARAAWATCCRTRHASPFVRRAELPRRRLLPLGRAGRRPRPAADAPAVGGRRPPRPR